MKKVILLILLACMSIAVQAQKDRLRFQTNTVAGTPLADSDVKPLSLLISADYNVHPRLSAGLGTGLSKYDHLMIRNYKSKDYVSISSSGKHSNRCG